MGFKDEKLWITLKAKAQDEEERCGERERENAEKYLTAVAGICQYGVDRAKTIRDTFPFYTLHDEVHICNVMCLMAKLLNDRISSLTRDEAALLVMAACCHDIGMSYTEGEKKELLNNKDAVRRYLDKNPSEYIKAYAGGGEEPDLSDEIKMNFFRSIHHERIRELLQKKEWPRELRGRIDKEDLIQVCRSHGEEVSKLTALNPIHSLDRRFCAILLRLADILDFDDSRVPQAIYEYNEFDERTSYSEQFSEEEWKKHLSSSGFRFESVEDHSYPYSLDYTAECRSIQIEQKIECYLDWVDRELDDCSKVIRRFAGRWNDFVLPAKVERNIQSEGYLSGQYRITLDQDQVMELFVGENLYSDPAVFVRELIQNAIDAVRTRKQLDHSLPSDWTGQINIRTWSESGCHWFRIEDNGIGMTEDIIRNYFLKVGRSYYNSDEFRQEKHRCKADPDYTPVSQFGIGILSCFMGDKKTNQVEVSTKHFSENGIYYPALRLSMRGINGYYYMADQEKGHTPEPMQGVTDEEKSPYRNEPGTVIAVRTNLYQTRKYRGFREIIDQYVLYPEVPIHFESAEEGSYDYPTEKEFMDGIHRLKKTEGTDGNGGLEFLLSDEGMKTLEETLPGVICKKRPGVVIRFAALDDYMQSPYLTGATMYVEVLGELEPLEVMLGEIHAKVKFVIEIYTTSEDFGCKISLRYSEETEKQIDAILDNYFPGVSFRRDEDFAFGLIEEVEDLNDRLVLEKYRQLMEPLCFEIVDLQYVQQRLEASTTFLIGNIIEGLQRESFILSHNGIICRKTATRTYNSSIILKKSESIFSIIMLKDKYRPMISLARNNIEQLNLETACALRILNVIVPEGVLNADIYQMTDEKYSYISMERYLQLFTDYPEWEAMLRFDSEAGIITAEELKSMIDEKGTCVLYFLRVCSEKDLYSELCFAYIKNKYNLYSNYVNTSHLLSYHHQETFIVVKKKVRDEWNDSVFPPSFCFELSEGVPNYDIVKNRIKINESCNKEHRLVKFLEKNSRILEDKVPGLWNKMLSVLTQEYGTSLVRDVNLILNDLRKITDLEIPIPDRLYLSKADVI